MLIENAQDVVLVVRYVLLAQFVCAWMIEDFMSLLLISHA